MTNDLLFCGVLCVVPPVNQPR